MKSHEGEREFMYRHLIELINQGLYGDVLTALEKYDTSAYTEELAIIAVSALLASGDYDKAKEYLRLGLKINPQSYELYLLLGNYFEHCNLMQAYLCYENAELYCDDINDKEVIQSFRQKLEESISIVPKLSIVVLSSNSLDILTQCLGSIRENIVGRFCEIIVVDNGSTGGVAEWLEGQKDIILIKNREDRGTLYGYNQGIKAADPEADILLLNSDTIMLSNSLFWLRMGLYEEEGRGAVGSVANYSENGQNCPMIYETIDEYARYAMDNNIWQDHPYEVKFYLERFALLLRREAIDEIGLMDIRFAPGQFEDKDWGLRLCTAGWQSVLCHNSLVYRSGTGCNGAVDTKTYQINQNRFKEKWSFDITYYINARKEIIGLINADRRADIHVLEIGCGLGATLAEIQYVYPNARVYGMELVSEVAAVSGKVLNVVQGDIEKEDVPFENIEFDYIILADVLEHLHNPEEILRKLAKRLKGGGAFLCSIPNIMNLSVLYPLVCGSFVYEDSGILDSTHIRFFTLDSIYRLFSQCGFSIEKLGYTEDDAVTEGCYKECLACLLKVPGCADEKLFLAFQYFFRAVKKGN